MKKSTSLILAMVVIFAFVVTSCKKTPAPTVEISATINGYTVTFSATVTDVDTYAWNFGDGQTSTEASPSHTYTTSGSYNVTLVVKGGGGNATAQKTVTIAASFLEMLTGGAAATNGKTWVLSRTVTSGTSGDGWGAIIPAMTLDSLLHDNFLDRYYLGSEYDNEYTFFANGNYTMTPVNDTALAGLVYGVYENTMGPNPAYDIGLCKAKFTPPASSTWTEHTEDLTIDAITDPTTSAIPPDHANVTFTGKTWVSLSDGAYFGILDFPTTGKFIIKEITPTKLSVALFLCGYTYGGTLADMMLPSILVQFTFVPKAAK